MGLRDLSLNEQYRSDKDDIISEFFIPCLSHSIEYDRCIEYVTVKSLTTLTLSFQNFAEHETKLRIVSGHRFRTSDLNVLMKLFNGHTNSKISLSSSLIRDNKMEMLRSIVENHKLEMKIAIPNSEEVDGTFAEKIGIFLDENDDVVAFTGTSNETFDTQNKNFESIDVFTSWNDKSRVENKIKDFENLWENKTEYLEVYDFGYAQRNNLLKYATDWIFDLA